VHHYSFILRSTTIRIGYSCYLSVIKANRLMCSNADDSVAIYRARIVPSYSPGGPDVHPYNTWFVLPARVWFSSGISLGSAVFAGLTAMSPSTQTHTGTKHDACDISTCNFHCWLRCQPEVQTLFNGAQIILQGHFRTCRRVITINVSANISAVKSSIANGRDD